MKILSLRDTPSHEIKDSNLLRLKRKVDLQINKQGQDSLKDFALLMKG